MKVLFTADIHIKLGQKGVPLDFARNRYNILRSEIIRLIEEHNIDLVIFGGDTFDRVPTMEELGIYFQLTNAMPVETLIISGNHEATTKTGTFLSYLATATNRANDKVKIIDSVCNLHGIDFIPYNCLKEVGKYNPLSNILVTHVRGEIPPHVKPEIDLSLLEKWDIVFAGDLHSHSNTQANIVYPGSPMTTSFHRSIVDTGVVIFDTEAGEWDWHKLNMPQLIRLTVSDPADMVPTEFHHTVYELEGNMSDLAKVDNVELLDRKIVRRSTDSALLLDPKMSISEELKEYALYILELPEDTVNKVISTYNDYAKDVNVG